MTCELNCINPHSLIKEFYYKTSFIGFSLKAINESFSDDFYEYFSYHNLRDPFNVNESRKEDVDFLNSLLGTNRRCFKWAINKPTGSVLIIDDSNKEKVSTEVVSQMFLYSSVMLFENIIIFLKDLCKSTKGNSNSIINEFFEEFKSELLELDARIVERDWSTIVYLHRFRIIRNSIIHSNSSINPVDKNIEKFNERLNTCKLKGLEKMGKVLIGYRLDKDNDKIFLDRKGFKELLIVYSQLAYVAYHCYCSKNNLEPEL